MGLSIVGLNVSVGKTPILCDVNLEVESGEFFCVLGNSGCGKSTLLKTIAGFMQEQTGDIVLDGRKLHALPPQKRGTIVVFQDVRLFSNMSVGENVAYALRLQGMGRKERLERAEGYLEMVQLGGFSRRFVHELSGGQAQRVAIARALAAQPAVLLLDEPFSSLDENLRQDMRELVLRIHRETGITTIMVTHDQREALSLSDRLAVIEGGKIMQVGTPQEVYEQPASLAVASFFADGELLFGEVQQGRFVAGGIEMAAQGQPDGPCVSVVRRHAIAVGAGSTAYVVEALEYRGEELAATFVRGGAQLRCSVPLGSALKVGDEVTVEIDSSKVLFFPGQQVGE